MNVEELTIHELCEWMFLTSTVLGKEGDGYPNEVQQLHYVLCDEVKSRAYDIMDEIRQKEYREQCEREQKRKESLVDKWSKEFPGKYLCYSGDRFLVVKESEDGKTIRELYEEDKIYFYGQYGGIDLHVFRFEDREKRKDKLFIGGHQFTIGKGPYKELMKQMKEEG